MTSNRLHQRSLVVRMGLTRTSLRTHQVIRKALPDAVEDAGKDVQEAECRISAILEIHTGRQVRTSVSALFRIRPAPDGPNEQEGDGPTCPSAGSPAEPRIIEHETDGETADHLGEPVEQVVECAGADGEEDRVEILELPGVEPVAGQEHGEEEEYPGVGAQEAVETQQLPSPVRLFGHDDARSVVPDDRSWIFEKDGDASAEAGEDDERNVRSVPDRVARRVVRQAELDRRTQYGAEVEDDPKDGDESPLLRFERVGEHQRALGRPE